MGEVASPSSDQESAAMKKESKRSVCLVNNECSPNSEMEKDKSLEENISYKYELYCKKKWIRMTLQGLLFAFGCLGALCAHYVCNVKKLKKKVISIIFIYL